MEAEMQRRAADAIVELCREKHAAIDGKNEVMQNRLDKIEETILKIQSRPPVWATLAMTAMGTMIGNLVGRL